MEALFSAPDQNFRSGAMEKVRLVALVLLYFLSSSALLVLNKVAITEIPNAPLLLLVQIVSTVVLVGAVGLFLKNISFRPSGVVTKAYASVAVVFLLTLYSNFKVIDTVGVNTFVVLRCTTPLLVAVLDWRFLGRELPKGRSIPALLGIFVSGGTYAVSKVSSAPDSSVIFSTPLESVFWSSVWLACFTLDMVYIKHVVDTHECNGLERTLYQNALAVPFVVLILLSPVETTGLRASVRGMTSRATLALLLSCVAGATLSFTGMTLRSEMSATVFTLIGIICKMASIILNEYFVEPENSFTTLFAVFSAILCSSLYKQAPLRAHYTVDDEISLDTKKLHEDRWADLSSLSAADKESRPWSSPRVIVVLLAVIMLVAGVDNIFGPGAGHPNGQVFSERYINANKTCSVFEPVLHDDEKNSLSINDTVTNLEPFLFGRLGNRVQLVSNMVAHAEKHGCHIRITDSALSGQGLGDPLLVGWVPDTNVFKNLKPKKDTKPCSRRTGPDWYGTPHIESACAKFVLQHYFKINGTSAFGRSCPSEPHAAMHVRSGDSSDGKYNTTKPSQTPNTCPSCGVYVPYPGINPSYWVAPTSYYAAAWRHIQGRKHMLKTIIFCETDDNPTCDFFLKLERIEPTIKVRVGEDLLEDLHLMLCADEFVMSASISTFRKVIALSGREQVEHAFTEHSVVKKSYAPIFPCSKDHDAFLYHFEDESARRNFEKSVTSTWFNTGYQRYIVNKVHDINYIPCTRHFCSSRRCRMSFDDSFHLDKKIDR